MSTPESQAHRADALRMLSLGEPVAAMTVRGLLAALDARVDLIRPHREHAVLLEREVNRLRVGIEVLADEWDGLDGQAPLGIVARDLRALLAEDGAW